VLSVVRVHRFPLSLVAIGFLLSGVAGAAGPVLAAVIVDATNRTAHAAILAASCAAVGAVILPVRATRSEVHLRE
jgi:hypothetical protein